MNFKKDFLNKRSLLKVILLFVSILIWVYFYTASKVSLNILIIFDLPSIINTFFTLNFALFLLLFPLTSCIAIALSKGEDLLLDILQVSIGIILGVLVGSLIFGLSTSFLLFGLFYLIVHIILEILTHNRFKERNNRKLFSVSNYATSKVGILLTIALVVVMIIIIFPHQKESAQSMEAGIVDMFVGDDLSNWLGTSFSINKMSTKASIDYIVSSQQYKDLSKVNNTDVEKFIEFMDDLSTELEKPTTDKDIRQAYANLDDVKLKKQIFETIHSIPLLIIVEEYFAIVFALLIASLAQLYFTIAFSLIGILYVYVFYKLFSDDEDKENV